MSKPWLSVKNTDFSHFGQNRQNPCLAMRQNDTFWFPENSEIPGFDTSRPSAKNRIISKSGPTATWFLNLDKTGFLLSWDV